jgi:hypothetical protein
MKWKPIDATTIDASYVRRVFLYDPETGALLWRHRDDVLPRVNKRFAGRPAGCSDGQYGYISIRLCDRLYQAHRLIWLYMTGDWPADLVDHIDGNPANNVWTNLRPATRGENNRNRLTTRKGRLKGTHLNRATGKWYVQIMLEKRNHNFGQFDTEEEAHAAYVEAARRLHGAFARTE